MGSPLILRDYQQSIGVSAAVLLKKYKIACLAMEVRCGKTLTSFHAAQLYGAKKVIFLTKKKAIKSIESDYNLFKPSFELVVTNYEQLQNFKEENFDLKFVMKRIVWVNIL